MKFLSVILLLSFSPSLFAISLRCQGHIIKMPMSISEVRELCRNILLEDQYLQKSISVSEETETVETENTTDILIGEASSKTLYILSFKNHDLERISKHQFVSSLGQSGCENLKSGTSLSVFNLLCGDNLSLVKSREVKQTNRKKGEGHISVYESYILKGSLQDRRLAFTDRRLVSQTIVKN